MRSDFAVCMALGFITLTEAPLKAQGRPRRGDQDAARYGWLSSLTEGKTQARASGKPLMVVMRCVP